MASTASAGHFVAICPNYLAESPTKLILKQHYRVPNDFTCFRPDSSVLFEVTGQNGSSTRRRQFTDPSTGATLFELRKRYLNVKENWYLEFPEGSSSNRTFSAAMKWKGWANFDVTFSNAGRPAESDLTVLEVRARTIKHTTFDVCLHGQKVIEGHRSL